VVKKPTIKGFKGSSNKLKPGSITKKNSKQLEEAEAETESDWET